VQLRRLVPLFGADQVHSAPLTVTSLDSIDKLISYGYFTHADSTGDDAQIEQGQGGEQQKQPPRISKVVVSRNRAAIVSGLMPPSASACTSSARNCSGRTAERTVTSSK